MRTELALQEFLASRIAANLSPATIEWYKDRLLPFAKSCPALPRRPEPIEAFLATVQGSPETKYDVFRALKTFFRFMSSRRRLPNPMDAIQSPRRPKTLMPTLEVGELMRLLQSTENPRDRALITLLVDCGVRAGEVPISEETRRLLLQVAAQGVLAQGLNEPHSLTAKSTIQELDFTQAMQSVMITNDGVATVYVKVNTLNAEPNEVRTGETLELDYNTHVIERIFYYTLSGQSEIRITGTG